MTQMRLLALLTVVVGCASAKLESTANNNPPDDADPGGDAGVPVDAPDIDAAIDAPPPVLKATLAQHADANVATARIACRNANNFTFENSYYRTFPLADFGITTVFDVTDVSFAVELATAGNGVSQPAQVRIGRFTGTLDAATFPVIALTQLASANIEIPNNATNVVVPISMFTPSAVSFRPTDVVYMEVLVPNGIAAGNVFFIGSNAGAETHPSYIRAPNCQNLNGQVVVEPSIYPRVTNTTVRLIMSVAGTH